MTAISRRWRTPANDVCQHLQQPDAKDGRTCPACTSGIRRAPLLMKRGFFAPSLPSAGYSGVQSRKETYNNDQLPMWNYYSSGGMQLSIDIDQLIDILPTHLINSSQCYAYSDVKYISKTDTVDTISFDPFSFFCLGRGASPYNGERYEGPVDMEGPCTQ